MQLWVTVCLLFSATDGSKHGMTFGMAARNATSEPTDYAGVVLFSGQALWAPGAWPSSPLQG